jgi:hypothetical protein
MKNIKNVKKKLEELTYEVKLIKSDEPEKMTDVMIRIEELAGLVNKLSIPDNDIEQLICPVCNCNKAYWNPVEEYNECPCGYNWTD